jgi:gluconate 5-dehydrogenase
VTTEPTVADLFNMTGKTALITGATGHLGAAMAAALAEVGANVIVSSRRVADAQAVVESLPRPIKQPHHAIELDQMNDDSLQRGFEEAVHAARQIDVLVNNGHEPLKDDWKTVSGDDFTHHLRNATAYFQLARLTRDHAVARSAPASIIMIGSMYGLVASYPDAYEGLSSASPVAYQVLKGGILQMTRHLAVYWAKDRIRVNALSPGPFPKPTVGAKLIERLSAKAPMNRIGRPHELKGAVVFLASDASSYMTGQNLVIDGGWTAW